MRLQSYLGRESCRERGQETGRHNKGHHPIQELYQQRRIKILSLQIKNKNPRRKQQQHQPSSHDRGISAVKKPFPASDPVTRVLQVRHGGDNHDDNHNHNRVDETVLFGKKQV